MTGAVSPSKLRLNFWNTMAILSVVYWGMMLMGVSGSCDVRSKRVQRQIPQGRLVRLFAFPFFAGRANGFLWAIVPFVGALLVHERLAQKLGWNVTLTPYGFYLLFFVLLAMVLQRLIWRDPRKTGVTPLLAILLLLLPLLLQYITFIFRSAGDIDWALFSQCWLPFSMVDPNQRLHVSQHLFAGVTGTAILVIFNIQWFVSGVKRFVPLQASKEPSPLGSRLAGEVGGGDAVGQ
jgi:hypothetical protein